MSILCIKVTNITQSIVLSNNRYYSKGKPTEKFSEIWVLGESNNGNIPLLEIYDDCNIHSISNVNPAFSSVNIGTWNTEWDLLKKRNFKVSNALNLVNPASDSYKAIQKCQVMSYVDYNDLLNNNGQKKAYIYKHTKSNIKTNTISYVSSIYPLSVNKIKLVGDIVNVKIGRSNTIYKGVVKSVEERIKQEVLIDQILDIEIDMKGEIIRKKYSANNIYQL